MHGESVPGQGKGNEGASDSTGPEGSGRGNGRGFRSSFLQPPAEDDEVVDHRPRLPLRVFCSASGKSGVW